MKKVLAFCCLVYLLLPKQVMGCSPITVPVLLNQSISGNNLLLDWQSVSQWICPGYTVQVEIACINASFSGNGPFYLSPELNKTMIPEAYPQQTISLSGLCPGQVYQFRAREGELSFAITSAWTSVFTFTVPGVLTAPVLNLAATTNTVCLGQASQLNASLIACGPAPISYSWFPPAGLSCTNCANPVASPSVSTTYTCFVEGNQADCWPLISSTIPIAVSSGSIQGTVFSNYSLCSGDSAIVILNTYAPFIQWESSVDGGNSWTTVNTASNSSSFTSPSLSSDVCYRAFVDGCGSQYTTNVTCVNVVALPQLTISSSASLVCGGETADLSAAGALIYNWSNGSTTASIAIMPTATTAYTVTGVNASGCASQQVFVQQFSECTGINSIMAVQNDLMVYPNPNTGNFTISSYRETYFLLQDQLGRTLQSVELTSVNKYTLTISNLAPGIYFITPSSGKGAGKKICISN